MRRSDSAVLLFDESCRADAEAIRSALPETEIAEMHGTSRQAVWDIIRRAEQTLREIEEKTGLVARAMQRRAARAEIAKLAETLPDSETKREILRRLSLLED